MTDPAALFKGPPVGFERIKATGAHFVRLSVSWAAAAPAERPTNWDPTDPGDEHYWWGSADAQIVNAVAAGLTPVVAITGGPRWAQGCTSNDHNSPDVICDLHPGAFGDFATAVARRYSGNFEGLPRVRFWQVQNEPNLFLFFNPQYRDGRLVSPDLYRALLEHFSRAVKAVDSSNLVILGGLAPLQRPGVAGPLQFTRKLLCMHGRKNPKPNRHGCEGGVPFDIFATNPYTTGGPTHEAIGPDDVSLGDLPELQRLLRAADRANRIDGLFRQTPLWISEFGWDSNPPDPGGLPMKLLSRWAAEALYRSWRAGVRTFIWYGLRDDETHGLPFDQSVQSGLYFRGSTLETDAPKRRLVDAFRFPFVAFGRRNGIFVWGRTPNGKGGLVSIDVRGRKGWRRVARVRASRQGIFRATVGQRGLRRRGSVRAGYHGARAVPFSLKPVRDFYQPPFG